MLNMIFNAVILVLSGMILLRIAGRKSISQMSVMTTVIMISIGTTIVQPLNQDKVWNAVVVASTFIGVLIVTEWLTMRFNQVDQWLNGKASLVISDGVIQDKQLKKLRMTVDQLEIRLREHGIGAITDVKTATLEVNGMLGYELYPEAKPLTLREFRAYMEQLSHAPPSAPLFEEVKNDSHANPVPKRLQ
ncbi:DUF421 domain-containing protein [Marinicrinis sediminis]|uniref:DUF421 domain-containing protein n=1 Tax=Marinicrinis sediminis TaxID=1652465 RepID=A0ABW5RBE4_9BACL